MKICKMCPLRALKTFGKHGLQWVYELRCLVQHSMSLDGAVEQLSFVFVECDFEHYFEIRLFLYKHFAQAQLVK